jgi:hypothetical protein
MAHHRHNLWDEHRKAIVPLCRMNGGSATVCEEQPALGNPPIADYALAGLGRCWMPELGRWSHIYHLDRRREPNESIPPSDVFYTLNVLLGMSRLRTLPDNVRPADIFRDNVGLLLKLPVAKYALGMALWTAAELRVPLPPAVQQHIDRVLADEGGWRKFRAQDLGMLLTGVVAQAKFGKPHLIQLADRLYRALAEWYGSQSPLFCDGPVGYRRRFGTFATQTYLTLACYHYGEFAGKLAPIKLANACTRRLIELQGEQGEWPWLLDARRGCVLDFYEVYSVHQYGMAPAFLELAERHGIVAARDALVKGFTWTFGSNQLGTSMWVPDLNLSIRSQVRAGELHTKKWRILRSAKNVYLRRAGTRMTPPRLTLRRECRSYELGWILWSFGQRFDLPELTHHPMFVPPAASQTSGSGVRGKEHAPSPARL